MTVSSCTRSSKAARSSVDPPRAPATPPPSNAEEGNKLSAFNTRTRHSRDSRDIAPARPPAPPATALAKAGSLVNAAPITRLNDPVARKSG